jgi:hypothetical protein
MYVGRMEAHSAVCRNKKIWRDEPLEKTFSSMNPEIGIRKIACNKIKDMWSRTGLYVKITQR